ncbi:hypothetical protein TNCV_222471 [Trichonephila clavipes]|nr:hypothetical protein TNCV_222471 [Trichonephila clavipes]
MHVSELPDFNDTLRQREHIKSLAALTMAFMVKGVASRKVMMSDFESDMVTKSEKSGQAFKSRSSRFGILKPATPLTDCQRLKKTIEK